MGGGRLNKSSKEKDKGQQSTDSPLSLFLSSLVCHACRSATLAALPCLPLCHACRVMVDRALWNHEPKSWIPPLSCFTHIFHHINEKVANTEEDMWNFSTNDRPGTGNCGDWRKPQMNEVPMWMYTVDMAWAMRAAKPSLHRGGKPCFGLCVDNGRVGRKRPDWSPTGTIPTEMA